MNATDRLKELPLTQLAAACGVHKSAISHWLRRNQVPARHCRTVERFTRGEISRFDLRPDVFGEGH